MSSKKHYMDVEKHLFLQILKKYSYIIEKKKSDTTSLKDKDEAWKQIVHCYNSSSLISMKRNVQQLKKMWSNMKSHQRDALTREKQNYLGTGGGPALPPVEIDPDIAVIAPDLRKVALVTFSSNISEEMINEQEVAVIDDVSSKLLKDYDNHTPPQAELGLQELNKVYSDTSCTENCDVIIERPPGKRSMESLDDIVMVPRRTKKTRQSVQLQDYDGEERELKIERIKRIIEQEETLAELKLQHEKTKQEMEIEYLKKKYELELRAATAAAELSEQRLKKNV